MDEGARQTNREIKERREAQMEDVVQKKLDRIIHLLEILTHADEVIQPDSTLQTMLDLVKGGQQ